MPKHYSAAFADGSVETRSSASRTYSHAWKAVASYPGFDGGAPRVFTGRGFSGSLELAQSALSSYVTSATRNGATVSFQGVAAVEEHARRAR